jgi:hypothetical protein
MIFGALTINLAGRRIQKGKQIGGTISMIVEVFKGGLISGRRQGGRETVESLDTCALVETVQVVRWIGIETDDMFHLWEKIRIGNLQVIFSAVGP